MRTPTPRSELYAWHNKAIRGRVQTTMTPECGFFLTRLQMRGQYVPGSIYMEQLIDEETGELLSDEVMRAEILGERLDVDEAWLRFAKRPCCLLEYRNRLGALL